MVDQIRAGTAYHRAQFYKDITIPFYGFNRPDAVVSERIRENWWRQGMMGAATAHYQCVKVLSETEFYDDLAPIDIPVLVMHGEDDQICPIPDDWGEIELLKYGTLKSYPGFPHGMPTAHADQINADLLTFIRGQQVSPSTRHDRARAWLYPRADPNASSKAAILRSMNTPQAGIFALGTASHAYREFAALDQR